MPPEPPPPVAPDPSRPSASVAIDAPIDIVWAIMLDMAAYAEWNPFIVRVEGVTGPPVVGQRMRLHVRWGGGGGATSTERFGTIQPPAAHPDGERRAHLTYDYLGPLASLGLVRGSREQALAQAPDGPTVYRTEEVFRGLLVPFVPVAKVLDGFQRHAHALKLRAESVASR